MILIDYVQKSPKRLSSSVVFCLGEKEFTNDILPIFLVMLNASWILETLRGPLPWSVRGMKWRIVCMLCRVVGAKRSLYVLSESTFPSYRTCGCFCFVGNGEWFNTSSWGLLSRTLTIFFFLTLTMEEGRDTILKEIITFNHERFQSSVTRDPGAGAPD